jgi:hypothetical protein
LAFPQRWEAGAIRVRFLCLPKGDPTQPFAAGPPAFSTANLVFAARLIGDLEHEPRSAAATTVSPLVMDNPPNDKAALLSALAAEFNVVPRDKPVELGVGSSFRKPLAPSYRTLTGNRELSKYIVGEDAFACALHSAQASQPSQPVELEDKITWGRLIAFVLKQPVLAEACGFIGETSVPLPDPAFFAKGGWLYIDHDDSGDYAAAAAPAGFTSLYAARIPPLGAVDRPLYAAVLFPVDGVNPLDDVYREAERYSSGFARMVHGAQEVDRGDAIRLAWDDEQVAEWLNRQVDPAHDAPMGTSGYRIDVRHPGDAGWNSLQRITSIGNLSLGDNDLGPFTGDSVVEVAPVQVAPDRPNEYWMPPYFATWRGSSLVLTDQDLADLHQHPELDDPAIPPHKLGREKVFRPLDDKLVPLRYGETYEFRVRLADLTRGGPEAGDDIRLPSDSITNIAFKRRTRPGQINVLKRPAPGALSIEIAKPRLGYPDALFTGQIDFADLENDFLAKPEREFSVPDPDVEAVDIDVSVRALDGDTEVWWPLYSTRRDFAGETTTLDLELQDLPTLDAFPAAQPAAGALLIPSARTVRFTLTAATRVDPAYFDFQTKPLSVNVEVRANAAAEDPLLAPVDLPIRALFFQPPPTDGSVANPADRLAQEIGLSSSRLTLSGRPGRRTVFGCSAALHHTLSTELSAITFASNADLIQRWINVLQFRIARDWSWDGLSGAGAEIRRTIKRPNQADVDQFVGTIQLSRAIPRAATTNVPAGARAPQRQFTDVFFFDAFDPKPAPGTFPSEITFEYRLEADPLPPLLVPITTPPTQTPKLVSAGIALSPFVSADDYSSTAQRERSLWIEFEAPPADKDDAYYVRVLAAAPDPMLTDEAIAEVVEPLLALDPEWMRLIVPGQSKDSNGLNAMDTLRAETPDGKHWIVPLPSGLNAASPELFGLYTYEIRLGHTDARWSTAQGRHGSALRVAGVQHPAPPLICQAARTERTILFRAPFATPVYQGRNVRPYRPKTQLWAVLYARVRQTDGASWRNLFLTRIALTRAEFANIDPDADAAILFGQGALELQTLHDLLRRAGLPEDAPLTMLAVELFKNQVNPEAAPDPLGIDLGFERILRISPLSPIPPAC